jgi:hypothetical protein
MGPWFEPGPGSQLPFVRQRLTPIFALRPIDYWSFGPRKSAHFRPFGGSSPSPSSPFFNDLRAFSRTEPRGDAARNGGVGGGEESSKKRTLGFLRRGSLVDPKRSLNYNLF